MFNVIQSLGLWQQCISMSCCCGIGEKPSGLDALLRIMCKYCRRVPEGVLVRVFFKSKWSLTASGLLVLVGLLFRFTSTVVGAKQANKAKSTNHLILFEPHYCDCNPKFLNPIKTNHWFKSIKMDRFSGQLAFVTSDLVQHSIKKPFISHICQLTMCIAHTAIAALPSEYMREEYVTSWATADQTH